MKIYVVDASILLTALLEENESVSRKIKEIFREVQAKKTQMYSSNLLPLEMANGLRFTIKDKKLSEEVFGRFSSLPIILFNLKVEHVNRVLELAYNLGTSVYDTSYHLLAKMLRGTFLTCDGEYFEKARGLKSIELVD